MNRFIKKAEPQTWQEKLVELAAAKKEYQENAAIMTPYEQKTIKRDIDARRESYWQAIQNGAAGELHAAIRKCMDADKRISGQKSAELSRWDSGKLAGERAYIKMQIQDVLNSNPNPMMGDKPVAQRLRILWGEVTNTNDLHKTRCALEEFANIPAVGDNALVINQLNRQAAEELASLRITPEIQAAEADFQQARNELITKREQLVTIGEVLGDPVAGGLSTSPMARAYKQVRIVPNSQGELDVHILPADSAEVTGVDMSNLKGIDHE